MAWTHTRVGAITSHSDNPNTTTFTYNANRRAPDRIDTTATDWETFTYTSEGARKTWTTPTGTGNYTYYPTGEMATSANDTGGGPLAANSTRYIYDTIGQRLLARNGDGTATLWVGNTRIERDNTNNLTGHRHITTISGHSAVRTATGTSIAIADHLGSTRTIIATNGTDTDHRYDPFGAPRTNLNTAPTDRGYTGQIRDNDRLAYYNARYYDPRISQFTQPDTIIPNPTTGADHNRYTYVRNNPTNYNDPTGHEPHEFVQDWLLNVLFGTKIHDVITMDVAANNPRFVLHSDRAVCNRGNDPKCGRFDLMVDTFWWMYEIKPVGSEAAAGRQLERYEGEWDGDALFCRGRCPESFLRGPVVNPAFRTAGERSIAGFRVRYSQPLDGIITYSVSGERTWAGYRRLVEASAVMAAVVASENARQGGGGSGQSGPSSNRVMHEVLSVATTWLPDRPDIVLRPPIGPDPAVLGAALTIALVGGAVFWRY